MVRDKVRVSSSVFVFALIKLCTIRPIFSDYFLRFSTSVNLLVTFSIAMSRVFLAI